MFSSGGESVGVVDEVVVVLVVVVVVEEVKGWGW